MPRETPRRYPRGIIASVAAMVVLGISGLASGPSHAAETVPVTISMMPAGGEWYKVFILFPDMPEPSRAQALMNDLSRNTGWNPAQTEWDLQKASDAFPEQTSVDFLVQSPFSGGRIPLEALAVTFRSYRELNVMIAHGGTFQYNGQPRYETKDVTIDALAGATSLAVRIVIRNPNVERVHLPGALTQPKQGPSSRDGGVPMAVWISLAVAASVAVWVLVYAVLVPRRKLPSPPAP